MATLTLGRSMPEKIVLEEDAEYDLGRCSESDLDTHLDGRQSGRGTTSSDGFPRAPGRAVVIVKMEGDVAGAMRGSGRRRTGDPDRSAEAILGESWDDIVHVARLLIERGRCRERTSRPKCWNSAEATLAPDSIRGTRSRKSV